MDKYHGQGGSYKVDPLTKERTLVDKPTEATDTGGARTSEGKPIAETKATQPALPLPPAKAPWEVEAPAEQPKKKGA